MAVRGQMVLWTPPSSSLGHGHPLTPKEEVWPFHQAMWAGSQSRATFPAPFPNTPKVGRHGPRANTPRLFEGL